MIEHGYKASLSLVASALLGFALSCSDGEKDSNADIEAYVYIPGATFTPGAPPIATGGSSTHALAVTPSGTTLAVDSPVTWTIQWDVTATVVTSIVIYEESLEGYFEIPLTDQEMADGLLLFEEGVSDSPPTEEICNRDYRGNGTCYSEAPQGTTELSPEVSYVGEDASAGAYEIYFEATFTLDFEWVEPDGGGGGGGYDNCSGASPVCNCSVEACCDSSASDCGYIVNGTGWFACDGSNCSAAANSVVSYCCPY